jgi:hypothetical protein
MNKTNNNVFNMLMDFFRFSRLLRSLTMTTTTTISLAFLLLTSLSVSYFPFSNVLSQPNIVLPTNPTQYQEEVKGMRQLLWSVEQELSASNPQQKQNIIYSWQQAILKPLSSMNAYQQSLLIQIFKDAMSPKLEKLILNPLLSSSPNGGGQPTKNTNVIKNPQGKSTTNQPISREQMAYNLGYDDGYKSGTTAKPSLCMMFSLSTPRSSDSYCSLQQQFPNSYSQGFSDGVTAAGNSIQKGEIPPPPIGQTRGSGSFNPYGGFDYCPANPDREYICQFERNLKR